MEIQIGLGHFMHEINFIIHPHNNTFLILCDNTRTASYETIQTQDQLRSQTNQVNWENASLFWNTKYEDMHIIMDRADRGR